MRKILTAAILGFGVLLASVAPSNALEPYSESQTQQFIDWCTGAKSTAPTVCSCAVQRLAQTVPPAALATFLSSQGGLTLSQTAIATAATVTDALVSCSK
ncbi:MAG: hypothetical protein OQJ99_11925 [Rhodospirillales bacterium]|nr:hypothetical protein [Rhodospirillales bacterium]MCW8861243.1 hypothetical protein [Rhodospirillales bacterium]MCW8951551.1 hypothetical protein [Rhodospirillales bacterium]MCW8969654.1 hypothetical protein [Rhodospirillales bacterium]MCW9001510.1 hypothetical protein [Rhodospirillales bacterium]